MKIISNVKKILVFVLIAVTSFSCSTGDDVGVVPEDNTIVGLVKRDPNFSILGQALTQTNLVATLSGPELYTVFAPNNTAFTAFLTANNFTSIDRVPEAILKPILLNHVIVGKKVSSELSNGYIKTLAVGTASATNKLSMYVDITSGVKLNGVAKVTRADALATNGVIHVVDAVIGLPTIVTHATANKNFTSLVGALTGAGQPTGPDAFTAVLSGTGPFTVFAPTNDAFTSLNTELAPGGIASVSTANLTKVLQYHVVNGANVLSTSLTNNQEVTTLLGQKFTVELPTTGPQIKDVSNRYSKIIATDVQCANGVIHVLEKVLLPTF
jgi:uncharacterized surface protein with fasciclin (FAS1) repeats